VRRSARDIGDRDEVIDLVQRVRFAPGFARLAAFIARDQHAAPTIRDESPIAPNIRRPAAVCRGP
jgi:hypothetical protein